MKNLVTIKENLERVYRMEAYLQSTEDGFNEDFSIDEEEFERNLQKHIAEEIHRIFEERAEDPIERAIREDNEDDCPF